MLIIQSSYKKKNILQQDKGKPAMVAETETSATPEIGWISTPTAGVAFYRNSYNMLNNKNAGRTGSLAMVTVDRNRFAAEILRGNARINMTQMAKPFGRSKRPVDWLKTTEAKDYIKAVSVVKKCTTADLVEVRQGGSPDKQGTWCNDYRIALRFAQWLSPEFAVACDDVLIRMMFGDAVFAEAINGVEPVIVEGKTWYNYRDAMASFGRSRKNSAWRRKKACPHCFMKLYGRNFISRDYFLAMQAYYKWVERSRQLELPLDRKEGGLC